MTDPVADALVRIKNGYMTSKPEVGIPYSKLIFNLCRILKKEGYVGEVKKGKQEIRVTLKYSGKISVLTDVKRVSKPGLRVYKGVKELPKVLNGLGVAIISTPLGLMTEKQAKKLGVGGEVMALVW